MSEFAKLPCSENSWQQPRFLTNIVTSGQTYKELHSAGEVSQNSEPSTLNEEDEMLFLINPTQNSISIFSKASDLSQVVVPPSEGRQIVQATGIISKVESWYVHSSNRDSILIPSYLQPHPLCHHLWLGSMADSVRRHNAASEMA